MTTVLNSRSAMIAGGVLAAGVVVYLLSRKLKDAAADAVEAVANVNEGTPYEGWGAVGTLGNITNRLSGGVLERFGEWIGSSAFDVFHKPYDPNNPNTPSLRKAATMASPTRPQDAEKYSLRPLS
jgi:hypothetical protein